MNIFLKNKLEQIIQTSGIAWREFQGKFSRPGNSVQILHMPDFMILDSCVGLLSMQTTWPNGTWYWGPSWGAC